MGRGEDPSPPSWVWLWVCFLFRVGFFWDEENFMKLRPWRPEFSFKSRRDILRFLSPLQEYTQ